MKAMDINKEEWRTKKYSFFQHTECEAFPCHETDDIANFNCLFCFCPLYALGEQCNGDHTTALGGVKDCCKCMVPHKRDNYGYIMERYNDILDMMDNYR